MTSLLNPVVLVGAFERHNFGDLLMGRVVGQFLKEQGMSPIFASILPADLRELGGMWVNAFADLAPHLPDGVPLVHVGGETLGCSLEVALRMDLPAPLHPKLASLLTKSINPTGLEDREFAYLTPSEESIRGKTYLWKHRYFFSLGGSSLSTKDPDAGANLARALESADWLSAREGKSLQFLLESGCSHATRSWDAGVLCPGLVRGAATADGDRTLSTGAYLLFHANERYVREHKHGIAAQLNKLSGQFAKIKIIMAGTAQNHDSFIANEEMARLLSGSGINVECSTNVNVDDTLTCLRDAACIVSTSLHFRIVALAFGRPRVSLENEKVASWAEDCDAAYPFNCQIDDLSSKVTEALAVPPQQAMELSESAQREASASLHSLWARMGAAASSNGLIVPEWMDPGTLQVPVGASYTIAPIEWTAELSRRIVADQATIKHLKLTISDLKNRLKNSTEQKRRKWGILGFLRRLKMG